MNPVLYIIRNFGLFILIFVLLFCIRFYTIQQKVSFYIDDIYTYVSSSPNNLTPEGRKAKTNWYSVNNFEKSKTYSAQEIKKSLFALEPSFSSIIRDIKTIRSANLDRLHPNLYFSIFRIWGLGIDGCDKDKMIKRGCYLNLIFFAFSYFFMYKLLSLIKDNKSFIALGLFFAFIPTSSLSLNLLIREYAMQEMFFILVCYISLLIFENIVQKKAVKVTQIFLYAVCFSMFLLSGYFSTIYVLLFFCFSLILSLCKHNIDSFKNLIIIAVSTLIITLIIYPDYFNLDLEYWQIKCLICNAQNMLISDIVNVCKIITATLYEFLFYPIIVVLFIIFALFNFRLKLFNSIKEEFGTQKTLFICILTVLSFITAFAITKIAFYRDIRYVAYAFISFSLILTLCTYLLNRKILQFIVITLYLICTLIPVFNIDAKIPKILSYDLMRLELLNIYTTGDTPLVFTDLENWYHMNYIVYFNNSRPMMFVENINNNELPEEYLLVTEKEYNKANCFVDFRTDYIYLIKNNRHSR